MDASAYDHLPEPLRQKVIEANRAQAVAAELSRRLTAHFAISDLQVAVTAQAAAVSGTVASEAERQRVAAFLLASGEVREVHNGLTVRPTGH